MSRRILLAAVLALPLATPAQALDGSLETPKEPRALGAVTGAHDADRDVGIMTGEETAVKDTTPDATPTERFKARASTRMEHWLQAMVQYDGTNLSDAQIARLNDAWATAQRDFAAMMGAEGDAFPKARETYTASMKKLDSTWSDLTQTAQAR